MINYSEINKKQIVSETDTFTEERYKQFYKHLPINCNTVLDVGCNTGRGGVTLKKMSADLEIIGLDCVQDRLDKLNNNIYIKSICSFSTNIDIEDSSLNAIVAGEFIEHISEEDIISTLSEFYRILAKGGRILLTTPNPNYIRLKLTGRKVTDDPSHLTQHCINELKKSLEYAGFINLKVYGSGKATRLLGENLKIMCLYGSYLIFGDKK